MQYILVISTLFLASISYAWPSTTSEQIKSSTLCHNADEIFTNATFITINPKQPLASAVAVTNGRLVAVDNQSVIMRDCRGDNTLIIDLKNTVVTPGFIDTYSQFTLYGWLADAALDLSTTNALEHENWKPIKSLDEFLAEIKAQRLEPSSWLVVNGYDQSRLMGHKLTQKMLDKISDTSPIIVFYSSGQKALLNKTAVRDLKGRAINVDSNGEISANNLQKLVIHLISEKQLTHAIHTAADNYARHGYTTVTESSGSASWLPIYNKLTGDGTLPVDVVYSPNSVETRQQAGLIYKDNPRLYPGPVTLRVDGAIREFSAFLTRPYLEESSTHGSDWRGLLIQPPNQLKSVMEAAAKAHIPIALECNGDAAIDLALNLSQEMQQKYGKSNVKPTFINAQVIRNDQMSRIHHLGIKVSWFAPHLYYWGESVCHQILGARRADHDLPLETALKMFGSVNIHGDSPATAPKPLELMDEVTQRKVQAWHYAFSQQCPEQFSPHEAISALSALKALTLDAATLHDLQKDKGSLVPGKLADMTILTDNPLSGDRSKIRVLGTVVRGLFHPATDKQPVIIPKK